MFALRRLGHEGFVEQWAHLVRSEPDAAVRRNAVMALGQLGEKEAVALLKRVREDPDMGVRLQALESMGLLGSGEAVKQLIFYANGAIGDQQAFALIALGRIGDPQCLETLQYGLAKAPHLESRLAAARALGMMGRDDGYRLASWALTWNQPDPKLTDDPPANQVMRKRTMACFALGAIGKEDALEPLHRRMEDGTDPRVQLAASAAVLRIVKGRAASGLGREGLSPRPTGVLTP
jgi:HEAT repeat protein